MVDDAQLLREHVETNAGSAFAELVQRHLGLVYHAAARQLGAEEHLAADVAQGVFLLLAEKAPGLVTHPSLAGWLHATTRFKVAETLRAERRRRARETAALLMNENNQDEAGRADWTRMRPVLDQALGELNPSDREAVLLRFFEQRPFGEIAARLRLTEAAAHKRVERALGKLRERLARRGLTSTAGALGALLTGHAAAAAPAGLAASVTGAVAAAGLPAAAAVGAVSFMSTKTAVTAAAAIALVAGGVAVREVIAERATSAMLQALETENVGWRARIRAARSRPAGVAGPTAVVGNVQPAAEAAETPRPPAERGGLASVEESRAFLRENPEVREAFANYLRVTLQHRYADLIATLGLDETRKERFLELLALSRTQILGEHRLTLAERDFERGELGQELRAVLGEAGYQAYREFDDKNILRNVNFDLTTALYATPTPLTPAQADEVDRILWETVTDPRFGPKHTGTWRSLPPERWERLLTEAARTLPAPQLEALRELEQRARFWRMEADARRAYDAKQKAGAPAR